MSEQLQAQTMDLMDRCTALDRENASLRAANAALTKAAVESEAELQRVIAQCNRVTRELDEARAIPGLPAGMRIIGIKALEYPNNFCATCGDSAKMHEGNGPCLVDKCKCPQFSRTKSTYHYSAQLAPLEDEAPPDPPKMVCVLCGFPAKYCEDEKLWRHVPSNGIICDKYGYPIDVKPEANAKGVSADPHPEDQVRVFPILVVAAMIVKDGKVLLERRAPAGVLGLDGMWDLPGGKVEIGEDPKEALCREILEEMGTTVNPVCLLPELKLSVWTYGDATRHWVIAAYRCELTGHDPANGDLLQWFDLHDLPDNLLTADRELIQLGISVPFGSQAHEPRFSDREREIFCAGYRQCWMQPSVHAKVYKNSNDINTAMLSAGLRPKRESVTMGKLFEIFRTEFYRSGVTGDAALKAGIRAVLTLARASDGTMKDVED